MEPPLKRVIDERFIRKKSGTCIVYIQYQYTTVKRTLLSTEIAIPPDFWDYEEGFITEPILSKSLKKGFLMFNSFCPKSNFNVLAHILLLKVAAFKILANFHFK